MPSKVKISIVSFGYTNVREFESLSIPDSGGSFASKGVNLLQIQNGYGKTTTLYLLRSLFTNVPIGEEHLEGYGYRQNHRKWGGDKNGKVTFQVKLKISSPSEGEEECVLGIDIYPVEKEQAFWTVRSKLGGRVEDWRPPLEFSRLFEGKDRFATLFLLDGETAKDLNRFAGSKLVHDSIRQVTGTTTLHTMIGPSGSIKTVVTNATKEALGENEGRGDSLERAFEAATDRMAVLLNKSNKYESMLKGLEKQRDEIKDRLDEKEEEHEKINSGITRKKEDWRIKERVLRETSNAVLVDLFNPSISMGPEWTKVVSFHGTHQRGKLPKPVGRTWFRELQELDSCICGNEWNDSMRTHVNMHSETYLEDRLMTYVKEVQDSVSRSGESPAEIGSLITKLKTASDEMIDAKHSYDLLKLQLPQNEREELQQMSEELGSVKLKIDGTKRLFDDIMSESDEYIGRRKLDQHTMTGKKITTSAGKIKKIGNLKELRTVLDHIQAELTEGGDAWTKKEGAELLERVLAATLDNLEKEIKIELESKLNGHLSNMVGAGLDGGLKVKIVDEGLRYYNPAGKAQLEVNVAAQLGGSYAFVSALNSYAEVSLPLVLDTPLAGFGKGMVDAWARLVPETFDQSIALINSLEREGLDDYHGGNNYSCWTIRREKEVVKRGRPQEGKMICDSDYSNFRVYEDEAHKGGGK